MWYAHFQTKILAVTMAVVLLCSCGRGAPSSWQEQYDLGVRYLSEGKYSEAVIAFTNAISIDDRQLLSYEGRGDAWFRMAEQAGSAGNTDRSALYASARLDYEKVLEFDEPPASTFEKLASVLETQGDSRQALRVLEQGVERTGDSELVERLAELRSSGQGAPEEPAPETGTETGSGTEAGTELGSVARPETQTSQAVAASARIFYNPDVYGEHWNALIARYQDADARTRCTINTYGIRFTPPISVEINGERVEIQEAECVDLQSVFDADQLYDYGTRRRGGALNTETVVTGIFTRADDAGEVVGPSANESDGYTYYHYNPNGSYVFRILDSDLVGRREE